MKPPPVKPTPSDSYSQLAPEVKENIQSFSTCDEMHALAISSKASKNDHEYNQETDRSHFGKQSSCRKTHSAKRFSEEVRRDLKTAIDKIHRHYKSEQHGLHSFLGNQCNKHAPKIACDICSSTCSSAGGLSWSVFVGTALFMCCIPEITCTSVATATMYAGSGGGASACFGATALSIYNVCRDAVKDRQEHLVELDAQERNAIRHFENAFEESAPSKPIEEIFREIYVELYVNSPPEAQSIPR